MSLLTALVHWNTPPEIISDFLGFITIRWYSLLFGLSFFIGYYIFLYIAKKENKKVEDLDDLVLYMFLATVIGARLGHCLFYDFHYYFIENPLAIFKIWEGGLASHGAIFTILPVLYYFIKKHEGYTYLWLLDRICWVIALAATFIRLGNFFNSEIVGVPTDGSWGIVFMQNGENFPRVPIMLFESASYFFVFILLSYLYVSKDGKVREGLMSSIFFTLMLTFRFICEFWKSDFGEEVMWGLNSGQLLSIPFIGFGIALLIYTYRKK